MDSLSLKKTAQHSENPEAAGRKRQCTGFPGQNEISAHKERFFSRKPSERL